MGAGFFHSAVGTRPERMQDISHKEVGYRIPPELRSQVYLRGDFSATFGPGDVLQSLSHGEVCEAQSLRPPAGSWRHRRQRGLQPGPSPARQRLSSPATGRSRMETASRHGLLARGQTKHRSEHDRQETHDPELDAGQRNFMTRSRSASRPSPPGVLSAPRLVRRALRRSAAGA